ncbi:DgyrCDS14869 [Dimorphilus gyrociliatus]|uniref:DgyrCDS14869 n=1 Tax=Dimorphilus gyrociliatus TaxID=2664684 RepID=A0A7I8WF57_9ANNE|nr:DgyrCDS14869 [Dimorphilus gyrociliatus]
MIRLFQTFYLFLALPSLVTLNRIYVEKSLCNEFVGRANTALENLYGAAVNTNSDLAQCMELCRNSDHCTSFHYNKASKDCTTKTYGSYQGGLLTQDNSLFYTKITNPDCENWIDTANKIVNSCDPCVLSDLQGVTVEKCREECFKTTNCQSINQNGADCGLLSSVAAVSALFYQPPANNLLKPQCLTMIHVSTKNICSRNQITSLGDGILECPPEVIKIPLNGQIIYTILQAVNDSFEVAISKLDNDKCWNIAVTNNPNNKSVLCNLKSGEDNLCKFECFGQQFNKIIVNCLSNYCNICEIEITSKDKLVNVCI